jgi:hypothetical protein
MHFAREGLGQGLRVLGWAGLRRWAYFGVIALKKSGQLEVQKIGQQRGQAADRDHQGSVGGASRRPGYERGRAQAGGKVGDALHGHVLARNIKPGVELGLLAGPYAYYG